MTKMLSRDDRGRFTSLKTEQTENDTDYGFYSKVLNKPFNSLDELKKAEKDYLDEKKSLEEKSAKKREDAHLVEESYENYIDTMSKTNKDLGEYMDKVKKIQNDAYNSFIEARNNFIEKYGSFHMTFVNKEPKVDTKGQDTLQTMCDESLDRLYDVIQALFPIL